MAPSWLRFHKMDGVSQNNLQNTCDVPKPVPGIARGVYSDGIESDEAADFPARLVENIGLSRRFAAVSDPETLLHLALESFHKRVDAAKLVKGLDTRRSRNYDLEFQTPCRVIRTVPYKLSLLFKILRP